TISKARHIAGVVNGVSASSANQCVTLALFDSGHKNLASGTSCYGNPVSFGYVDLPAGSYTVRFEIYDATAIGHGTLWLSATRNIGTATVNGPAVPMNVDRVGRDVEASFTISK